MATENEFVAMDGKSSRYVPAQKKQRTGVVKNVRKQPSGTIHIDPGEADVEEGVEFFQPIYEGDVIVGVIHKCACGRTAELRFQYSEQ